MTKEAPYVRAAFINAIAEEGSKAEAIEWLQKTWNERCALTVEVERYRKSLDFCQKVLAILIDPKSGSGGISNAVAWANCVQAEALARAALQSTEGER